jgi:hypothetical protein
MLMKVSEYRMMFTPGSRPDPRTVRRWVERGELYGEQRGGLLYVDPARSPGTPSLATVSPAVLRIVNS